VSPAPTPTDATITRRRPYTRRMPPEQRRDQVLDAALAIIAREGYAAVSIEAIARELDVTRPVIYNVYGGLADLLHALLDRQERRAMTELTRTISAIPPDADVRRYLTGTISGLVDMVTGDPLTWLPIFRAAVDTPAIVRSRIERDRELVRARIASLVQGWLDTSATGVAPSLRERMDSEIVAHMLVGIGEYFGRLLLADPAAVDAHRLAATITALFVPPAAHSAEPRTEAPPAT
jgi:AcrR family transcriptional regulator